MAYLGMDGCQCRPIKIAEPVGSHGVWTEKRAAVPVPLSAPEDAGIPAKTRTCNRNRPPHYYLRTLVRRERKISMASTGSVRIIHIQPAQVEFASGGSESQREHSAQPGKGVAERLPLSGVWQGIDGAGKLNSEP